MDCFGSFVRRWAQRGANATRFIFTFCAMWRNAAKLFDVCYGTAPKFGSACGDATWSAAEKVKMLRRVRDGLPGGVAAKVEPVKLVVEEIIFVALAGEENIAKRDSNAAERANSSAEARSSPLKRARLVVGGEGRNDSGERPLAVPTSQGSHGGWGKIPRKCPAGEVSLVKSAAKVDFPTAGELGNLNESFHERRGTAMRRNMQETKAGSLPPISPLSLPSPPPRENRPSPLVRHASRPGGNGPYPPKTATRHFVSPPNQHYYCDASGGVRNRMSRNGRLHFDDDD